MKKILIIVFVALIILLVIAGFGLQLFLTRGLPVTLNNVVFPAIRAEYGLDMRISDASVNLIRGTVSLNNLNVRNLDGYEKPFVLVLDECVLDVEMRSLLRRNPIIVREVRATGAELTVERNRQGEINLQELAKRLELIDPDRDPDAPVPTPAPPRPPEEDPVPPPPIHLRRIELHTLLTYVDAALDRPYTLELTLSGTDLFTVPDPQQPDTRFSLRGALVDDRASFVTDLNLLLSPLVDPDNPTFTADGSILDIRADLLGDLLQRNQMDSPSFSIRPSITCREGNLLGSTIQLVLNDLSLYGTAIGDTRIALPVRGTIHQPSIDLTGALQSLFNEQAAAIGRAIGQRHLQKEIQKRTGDSDVINAVIQQLLPGRDTDKDVKEKPPEADEAEQDQEKEVPTPEEELKEGLRQLDPTGEVEDALRSLRDAFRGRN